MSNNSFRAGVPIFNKSVGNDLVKAGQALGNSTQPQASGQVISPSDSGLRQYFQGVNTPTNGTLQSREGSVVISQKIALAGSDPFYFTPVQIPVGYYLLITGFTLGDDSTDGTDFASGFAYVSNNPNPGTTINTTSGVLHPSNGDAFILGLTPAPPVPAGFYVGGCVYDPGGSSVNATLFVIGILLRDEQNACNREIV